MKRLIRTLGIAAVPMALILAGCSGGQSPAQPTEETGSGTVQLWDWSMSEDTQAILDLWHETHPDIEIVVTNPGSGPEYQAKMIAANAAGEGPDAAALLFQDLPAFISNGTIADSSAELAQYKDEYVPSAWAGVEFEGATYALPSDVAPMMFWYRTDLFEQYGLEVPETWDEYREQAEKLRQADPSKRFGNYSPMSTSGNWFIALTNQAECDWWKPKGDKWSVGIDGAGCEKVADFWGGLVGDDLVSTFKDRTPEWNAAISADQIVTLVGSTWSWRSLANNAPQSEGKWAVAPIPQWEAGDSVETFYGGATYMIPSNSKNREGAREFIHWITSDPKAVALREELLGNFPTTTASRETIDELAPPAFIANQPDFWVLADQIDATGRAISYGPDVPAAYSAYEAAFSTAVENGTSFTDALSQLNEAVIADMKKSGFTLAE